MKENTRFRIHGYLSCPLRPLRHSSQSTPQGISEWHPGPENRNSALRASLLINLLNQDIKMVVKQGSINIQRCRNNNAGLKSVDVYGIENWSDEFSNSRTSHIETVLYLCDQLHCIQPMNQGCEVTRRGSAVILTSPFTTKSGSISRFSCSLTGNITSHSVKNLAFHHFLTDERWLYHKFYTFLFRKVGRMFFLNLGVKGLTVQFIWPRVITTANHEYFCAESYTVTALCFRAPITTVANRVPHTLRRRTITACVSHQWK